MERVFINPSSPKLLTRGEHNGNRGGMGVEVIVLSMSCVIGLSCI